MYSEVIDEAYDFEGHKIFKPSKKRHRVFHPTFPLGLFANSPIFIKCNSLQDLKEFLKKCRYVSDREQFGRDDYWIPPENFERNKKGDCEDFALYTWRQLLEMGYESRFVCGSAGRYGSGHAWVTAKINEKRLIIEPLASFTRKLPKLSFIRYKPEISIEWDGKKIHYYSHEERKYNPAFKEVIPLVFEWLLIMPVYWIKTIFLFGKYLFIRFLIKPFSKKKNKGKKKGYF